MSDALITAVSGAYRTRFGAEPQAVAFAPGRVNLMGEHTDYSGGLVLPVTLRMGIAVALGPSGRPGTIRMESDGFDTQDIRRIGDAAMGHWGDYAYGSVLAVAEDALRTNGFDLMVSHDLPSGAGLSSSAAIEVATLRAASMFTGRPLDPVKAAMLARGVENDFVGMPCGVMDQFAVSVGKPGASLFLDTATLEHEGVTLMPDHRFMVIHSGVSHKLTEDGYATRVEECRRACAALGIATLEGLGALGSDALDRVAALPDPLDRRVRHIITENARVRAAVSALRAGDAAAMGAAMNASHLSQRDDYEVSVPEVDHLVEAMTSFGAVGARLTGGGFGGSIVALVDAAHEDSIGAKVNGMFPQARLLASI